jgi:hypothetical protein
MGKVPLWVPTLFYPLVEWMLRRRNMRYAFACVRDSLARGEAPYASHVFFDRRGLLNDAIPDQRNLGIEVGFAWGRPAKLRAVYCDHGISGGMSLGIAQRPYGQQLDYRHLYLPKKARPNVCLDCGRNAFPGSDSCGLGSCQEMIAP